jgi:hypothetical protein
VVYLENFLLRQSQEVSWSRRKKFCALGWLMLSIIWYWHLASVLTTNAEYFYCFVQNCKAKIRLICIYFVLKIKINPHRLNVLMGYFKILSFILLYSSSVSQWQLLPSRGPWSFNPDIRECQPSNCNMQKLTGKDHIKLPHTIWQKKRTRQFVHCEE